MVPRSLWWRTAHDRRAAVADSGRRRGGQTDPPPVSHWRLGRQERFPGVSELGQDGDAAGHYRLRLL
jgi:hypothetical protein